MLSRDKNDLLTQTGPGTPCGAFLRSYWQPIAAAEEMPVGGAPMPIRIMSEDLVLFRDDSGALGLIGQFCPHRGTDLSYGRVEDGGLRCLYHGWLFDRHGQCLDQPAEPANRKFCDRIKHLAYPVQEKGGAIWTYMGKGEPPLIPGFRVPHRARAEPDDLSGDPDVQLAAGAGKLDRSGSHDLSAPAAAGQAAASARATISRRCAAPSRPRSASSRPASGRGFSRSTTRRTGENICASTTTSTRTGRRLRPRPAKAGIRGAGMCRSTITQHCRFEFFYRHSEPLDKAKLIKNHHENVGPDNRHIRRPENRYLQDRAELKRNESYGGMGLYFPAQDAFAIETQGTIQDRTKEHLGSTDIVITGVRRALLAAIKQTQDGGAAPWVQRDASSNAFADFICTSGYIEDDEDGPSFCRRVLASKAAAE